MAHSFPHSNALVYCRNPLIPQSLRNQSMSRGVVNGADAVGFKDAGVGVVVWYRTAQVIAGGAAPICGASALAQPCSAPIWGPQCWLASS